MEQIGKINWRKWLDCEGKYRLKKCNQPPRFAINQLEVEASNICNSQSCSTLFAKYSKLEVSGPLRSLTSSWTPFGPLNIVFRTLRLLKSCDPCPSFGKSKWPCLRKTVRGEVVRFFVTERSRAGIAQSSSWILWWIEQFMFWVRAHILESEVIFATFPSANLVDQPPSPSIQWKTFCPNTLLAKNFQQKSTSCFNKPCIIRFAQECSKIKDINDKNERRSGKI